MRSKVGFVTTNIRASSVSVLWVVFFKYNGRKYCLSFNIGAKVIYYTFNDTIKEKKNATSSNTEIPTKTSLKLPSCCIK